MLYEPVDIISAKSEKCDNSRTNMLSLNLSGLKTLDIYGINTKYFLYDFWQWLKEKWAMQKHEKFCCRCRQ